MARRKTKVPTDNRRSSAKRTGISGPGGRPASAASLMKVGVARRPGSPGVPGKGLASAVSAEGVELASSSPGRRVAGGLKRPVGKGSGQLPAKGTTPLQEISPAGNSSARLNTHSHTAISSVSDPKRTAPGGASRDLKGQPRISEPAAQAVPVHLRDAIRIGLCGIGRTGFGRIRNEIGSSRQFVVQAGFDLLHERAEQLRDVFGSTAHASFEDLLDDDAVELVIIATRSDTHAALAMQSLRAGKHVVVEKPMATNLADADAMIELAKRSKGRLFVRHNRRFDPPFRCALEAVESRKLGRLHSVQIRVGEYVRRSDWQTIKGCGGGQLLNWGPHVIDWALQLIGGRAVEQWSDLKLVAAAGDAEDHVKLLLKGPDVDGSGGVVADLEISGGNASKQPPFILHGDRGAMIIDGQRCKLRYLRTLPSRDALIASTATPGQDDRRYKIDDKSDWIEEDLPATPSTTTDFWSEIYRTLRKGSAFPVTLAQAREVMRVIETCRIGTRFENTPM